MWRGEFVLQLMCPALHVLQRQVEGTCSAKHGYVLSVLAVDDISKVCSITCDCYNCYYCYFAVISADLSSKAGVISSLESRRQPKMLPVTALCNSCSWAAFFCCSNSSTAVGRTATS